MTNGRENCTNNERWSQGKSYKQLYTNCKSTINIPTNC